MVLTELRNFHFKPNGNFLLHFALIEIEEFNRLMLHFLPSAVPAVLKDSCGSSGFMYLSLAGGRQLTQNIGQMQLVFQEGISYPDLMR